MKLRPWFVIYYCGRVVLTRTYSWQVAYRYLVNNKCERVEVYYGSNKHKIMYSTFQFVWGMHDVLDVPSWEWLKSQQC